MKVYTQWIKQLSLDREHATTQQQEQEYDEWIQWIQLQRSNNRTRDIVVYHWRLEGVEHGPKSLAYIENALVNGDGIYPDLEEEEGPSTLDHIDV